MGTNMFGQKLSSKEKIVAKRVKKYIEDLTYEGWEGRLTGSYGGNKAADYIAEEFDKVGLSAFDKSFYQSFYVPNLRMAQANTSLTLNGKSLTLFNDYYPISASSNNGRYKGEAINVSYGIEDGGLEINNYKGIDLKGKAALINIALPDGGTSSKYLGWEDAVMRANYAKSKGAKAVIFYSDDTALFPVGSLEKSLTNSGIPVLFISKDLKKEKKVEVNLNIDILILSTEAKNVMGYIDNGAMETVMVSAHYDHLGLGQSGGSRDERSGVIHPGADDNASGVSALFELAKELLRKPKHFRNHNYLFVAFAGNEQELMGSRAFMKSPLLLISRVTKVINIDMIGHLDATKRVLTIDGTKSSLSWERAINKVSFPDDKIAQIDVNGKENTVSDHSSFADRNIPAINVTTGEQKYNHTSLDNASVINYAGETYIIKYLCYLMYELDKTQGQENKRMKGHGKEKKGPVILPVQK